VLHLWDHHQQLQPVHSQEASPHPSILVLTQQWPLVVCNLVCNNNNNNNNGAMMHIRKRFWTR